jgi:hypothetical protein
LWRRISPSPVRDARRYLLGESGCERQDMFM